MRCVAHQLQAQPALFDQVWYETTPGPQPFQNLRRDLFHLLLRWSRGEELLKEEHIKKKLVCSLPLSGSCWRMQFSPPWVIGQSTRRWHTRELWCCSMLLAWFAMFEVNQFSLCRLCPTSWLALAGITPWQIPKVLHLSGSTHSSKATKRSLTVWVTIDFLGSTDWKERFANVFTRKHSFKRIRVNHHQPGLSLLCDLTL